MPVVPWKICLFGRLSAQRGERRVTNFRTEKTGVLLACLAQEPRRPVRREELIEQLWPNQLPDVGRNRLRVALTYLRQILEPDPDDQGTVVIADRREVKLSADSLTTDTLEFESNLTKAARARDEAERVAHLDAAVAQYQSDFLPEFEEHWITAERQRLADAYQLALRRLVKAHMNIRQFDRALGAAQRAVRADPYREETHRLLMQVYSALGRPTAALRQYKELETLLREGLGSAPSRETQETLAKLNAVPDIGTRPASPQKPPHRTGPARVGLQNVPSGTATRRPAQRLPAALTPLIGREDEIAQVLEMIGTPETRLINLIGVAGVGKTRLALAVAEQVRSQGRPVCFLSLVGLTDAAEIPARIASAFHLQLRPRADLWNRLIAALADEAVLLVLDNVEHLLPEAAEIVQRLLESVPSLFCLVTSRHRLCVAGEYAYRVPALRSPADGGAAPNTKCASVRLWLDRAIAAAPAFRLTAENRADVDALCGMLDGLPLAIELAAAWADVLTPKQIAARLASRFDLLVSRGPATDGRHKSLRAALDWSYDLLPKNLQVFLARLGWFRAGWTLETASAVGGVPDALRALAQLRERSLIVAEETESGMRYRLLETVREYALAQLGPDELTDTNRRAVDCFAEMACEAGAALKGSEAEQAMRRLHREEENLRAALGVALEDARRPGLPLKMAVALYRYWYISGAVRQGRHWLTAALEVAAGDDPERPKGLTSLGNLAYGEGDPETAQRCYEECREIYAAAGDHQGIASALGNLANVHRYRNDLPKANALAQQCLHIYRRLGDRRGESLTLGNLALIARGRGDDMTALEYGDQALTQFRLLGDRQNLMIGLANMSGPAMRLGRDQQAAAHLRESLDLCVQLTAERTLATVLVGTAMLSRKLGLHREAIQLNAAAAVLWQRLGIVAAPETREEFEADLTSFRRLLGDDVVEREWDRGLHLSSDGAITLADACLQPSR